MYEYTRANACSHAELHLKFAMSHKPLFFTGNFTRFKWHTFVAYEYMKVCVDSDHKYNYDTFKNRVGVCIRDKNYTSVPIIEKYP